MIPLSERINLELRHRNPAEITELILDTSKSDTIEGLTDEYVNLKQLSLVNVGLKSLVGFPSLPNLEILDLSDNRISCGLHYLNSCPNLNQLLLTGNRIKNISDLTPLSNMPALQSIDLCNCEVARSSNYREQVFQLLPQLVSLDGFDINLVEDSDYDDNEYSDGDDQIDDIRGYCSGKIGKNGSHTDHYDEYVVDDDDDGEYSRYNGDVRHDNGGHLLFETYNSHHDDDDGLTDSDCDDDSDDGDDDDDDEYCPPIHGSKFAPSPAQIPKRSTVKRFYSSTDENESARKMFIVDDIGSLPRDN